MKRWRDSIATTIALTVIIAMVLGFSLQQLVSSGLLYLGVARQQTVRNANPRLLLQLPGRIAVLLDILDATPGSERPIVVAAAQRPLIRVRLLDAPIPNLVNRGELDADLLRRRIEAVLTVPRPLVVANSYRPADQHARTGGGGPVENGVFIEAALSDGQWLLFASPMIPPPAVDPVATQFARANFAAWLALSILLGILLSMLAARRLVKPLAELATAAEQLGGSGDAPPLPPSGPRELQVTIGAFNRMQERLRRFNHDRTRMLAAMSHDLRTPVTRLRLRLELVEDSEQQQKMLTELDTMAEMIESVLLFARDDTRSCPRTWCKSGGSIALSGGVGRCQADYGGQPDDRIVAQWCDSFQGHVAGALDRPFIVLFEQDGADEAGDCGLVWEDADDLGAALDLAVEPLQRIGAVDLGPVILGKAHEGEDIGFGFVHQCGELGHLGPELIGDLAPLGSGHLGILLGEGGGDEGGDDAAALLAGMGQDIAHEVYPAALPGRMQHLGDRCLQPLMRIRDHQLDAAQAAPRQRAQEVGPEGLGLRRRR